MANLSKREFLGLGGVALIGLVGVGYAIDRSSAAGWQSEALNVKQMKATGGLIVDIRTPPEWSQTGVIDGADLVTFTDPANFLAKVGPEIADGRDLILICHSGNRSSAAARALAGKIPNRIVSVDGGMSRVISGGYRTVPPT